VVEPRALIKAGGVGGVELGQARRVGLVRLDGVVVRAARPPGSGQVGAGNQRGFDHLPIGCGGLEEPVPNGG